MRLTFLGTGSAMPTPGRAQAGYLLERDDDCLLVDCGSGVLGRLAETQRGYEAVDTVVLTHLHLDHVADLLPLAMARWLAGDPNLTVVGPPGTRSHVDGLLDLHGYLDGRVDVAVREVEAGSFSVAGFDVSAMETRHSLPCHAYRFGDAVTLSGDSEAFSDLVSFAGPSSVLVHDCSFPDGVDVDNHPTASQLGRALAAGDGEFDAVYLTHLYPHTEGHHGEMLASIEDHYGGSVAVAEDGETVVV